jgi:hypothetical protein
MKICGLCGDWNGSAYQRCPACGARWFFPYSPGVQYWLRWHDQSQRVSSSLTRFEIVRPGPV